MNPPVEPRLSVYLANAERLLKRGNFYEARGLYRRALTLSAEHEQAKLGFAKTSLSLPDGHVTTVERRRQLSALLSEYPNDGQIAASLAELELHDHNISLAIQLFERALAVAPDRPHVHHGLGLAYVRARAWASAITHLRQAVALASDQRAYLHDLGRVLLRNGSYDHALTLFEADVKNNPSDPYPRLEYARALRAMNEVNRATSVFKLVKENIREQISTFRPWKFLAASEFVYLVAPQARMSYVRLQLGVNEVLQGAPYENSLRPLEPPTPVVVLDLLCIDLQEIAKALPHLVKRVEIFASTLASLHDISCPLPTASGHLNTPE